MNIKDFKWTEKRFGAIFANILKRIAGDAEEAGREIEKFFKTTDTGEIDFEDSHGDNHTIVTASALEDEDSNVQSSLATALINRMENEAVKEALNNAIDKNNAHKVTWQELKDLRDGGNLIPGHLYRITDYNCTTTQQNTRSAGHQFDIVLLALSNNKLAEEGWAMMNESNVYDVTFSDGVTKKCYLYGPYDIDGSANYNLVDISTFLGYSEFLTGDFSIEGNTITITNGVPINSTDLTEEDLTYNYFQNSNLSAWKVWYCLDNDTARFAWADDSVDEDSPAILTLYNSKIGNIDCERDSSQDIEGYYAWTSGEQDTFYTNTLTPTTEDNVYNELGEIIESWSIISYTPAHEGTGEPNGRGVIYRLIDEFNNDCPYDFKNIQYVRPLTNGAYDANGTDTLVYTFNKYDSDNSVCVDATIESNVFNCKIEPFVGEQAPTLLLGNNVCNSTLDYFTDNKFIGSSCGDNTLQDCSFMYIINSTDFLEQANNNVIILYNSIVATE